MTAVPAEPLLVLNGDDGVDDTSDGNSNGSFDIPIEASLCERIMDEPSPARLDHEDEFDFWFDAIVSAFITSFPFKLTLTLVFL